MKTIKQILEIIYLTIFYKAFYSKEKKGYMTKKRIIPFLLITPITIPFWMLCSVFDYLNYINEYKSAWIEYENKKLTFKQRLAIKLNLR